MIREDLTKIGFKVEEGKKRIQKVSIHVLLGRNNVPEKSFQVDAYNSTSHTVVEIEAGRAVTNHQFLKDFFEALIMIDVNYLVIAVRRVYAGDQDFESVIKFFDALYSSSRLEHQLKGLLVIGY